MKARWKLTCVPVFTAVLLVADGSKANDRPETSTDTVAAFDIGKDADHLLLPVGFRGDTYLFLLDTGADLTIYDSRFRPHLGVRLRASRTKTPNHEMRVDLFRSPSTKLGELDMQADLPVMCMDLSKVRAVTGYDVYGMIGMDFLRDHVIQLDLDRGKVSFLRSVPQDAGRPVRIFYRSLHPRVIADVAGITATFTVDTGCSHSGSIDTNIFDQLVDRKHVGAIGTTPSTSLSGIKHWRDGRVTKVSVGEFTHRNLVLTEAQGNQLGLAYLSRYVVTFDFPNTTMYLKPGQRFDMADLRDMSGLHILRDNGNVVVHSVDGGSPAALAGIRQHDVITTVAGRAAQQYKLSELRRLLRLEGRQIEMMIINQDSVQRRVTVNLKDWRGEVTTR